MTLAATLSPIAEHARERLAGRARELAALLYAIEGGELLSDVPADPRARARHAAGVGLLAVLDRELSSFIAELDGTSENDATT